MAILPKRIGKSIISRLAHHERWKQANQLVLTAQEQSRFNKRPCHSTRTNLLPPATLLNFVNIF